MLKSFVVISLACAALTACNRGPAYTESQRLSFSKVCSTIKGEFVTDERSTSRGSFSTQDKLFCRWRMPTRHVKGAFRDVQYEFSERALVEGEFVVTAYGGYHDIGAEDQDLLFVQACNNLQGRVTEVGAHNTRHCLIDGQYFESLSIREAFPI